MTIEESQEQSEEASDEQASNDAQQPEVIGLPSPELVVENGKIIDVTGETLTDYIASLGEVSQVFNIPETPNLIENIPTILKGNDCLIFLVGKDVNLQEVIQCCGQELRH